MKKDAEYAQIKAEILSHLPKRDANAVQEKTVENLARRLCLVGKPITRKNMTEPLDKKEVVEALRTRKVTLLFGGGKDSELVVSAARLAQIEMLERYGETFNIRIFKGEQPAMLDVGQNVENCYEKLGLRDDPRVELYTIRNHEVVKDIAGEPLGKEVVAQHRSDVLNNAHQFSGAGRRTFCDDCNITLGGWIATALAYDGGADVYITGDGPQELKAQIKGAVPKMAAAFKVKLPDRDGELSQVQHDFLTLNTVAREKLMRTLGDVDEVRKRAIPVAGIPDRTRMYSVFEDLPYESKGRLEFYTEFLNFSFDSLMFSFTESDCGNPALMCHLYGLMAEHAYKDIEASYADGVRAYAEYAIGKMYEKGFPEHLVQKMRDRYQDDAHIEQMRTDVQDFAMRAYGFTPDHLIAMVYAPITQRGTNLHRYLEYLKDSGHEKGEVLLAAEDKIKDVLGRNGFISKEEIQDAKLDELSKVMGVDVPQMRYLFKKAELKINVFNPQHEMSDASKELLEILRKDVFYMGTAEVQGKCGTRTMLIEGR